MKSAHRHQEIQAWTHYWSRAAATSSDCLPDLPAPVSNHLQEIWLTFFDTLPVDSSLLDVGTGSGLVLALAQAYRPDLQLTGIDYAAELPDLGQNITLYPNTTIEELPFDDGGFGAVTSQFALEYAALPEAVSELSRVMDREAHYLLICHHSGGVIVRDNVARMVAIKDLLGMHGLVDGAVKFARHKKQFDQKAQSKLTRLLRAAQLKHPDQSVVNEVAESIAKIIKDGSSLKKLLMLRREVEMEGLRIRALEKAALTEIEVHELAAQLPAGKNPPRVEMLAVPRTDLPFAWKITNQLL